MSAVAASWPSIVSIMHDSMRHSVDMVGNVVPSLERQLLCFIPLDHPCPLILTSPFLSLRKIRYTMLLFCCS